MMLFVSLEQAEPIAQLRKGQLEVLLAPSRSSGRTTRVRVAGEAEISDFEETYSILLVILI